MQVCVPSTPAQMFHMIRRQMLRSVPQAADRDDAEEPAAPQVFRVAAETLSNGRFELIRSTDDDSLDAARPSVASYSAAARCITTWLKRGRSTMSADTCARSHRTALSVSDRGIRGRDHRFDIQPQCEEIIWCQEEPQNQGAWYQIRHRLQEPLASDQQLFYAGRPSAAAPASGVFKLHAAAATGAGRSCAQYPGQGQRVEAPGRQTERRQMTSKSRSRQLPESVTDATLVAWHKKPGDAVARDENLVDLETDKVVLEVPAPASGVLGEIKVKTVRQLPAAICWRCWRRAQSRASRGADQPRRLPEAPAEIEPVAAAALGEAHTN